MNILGDCNSEQPGEPIPGRGLGAQPLPGVAPGAATQVPAQPALTSRLRREVEREEGTTPVSP